VIRVFSISTLTHFHNGGCPQQHQLMVAFVFVNATPSEFADCLRPHPLVQDDVRAGRHFTQQRFLGIIVLVANRLPSVAMPGIGISAIFAPANARAASAASATPLIPTRGHGKPNALTTAPTRRRAGKSPVLAHRRRSRRSSVAATRGVGTFGSCHGSQRRFTKESKVSLSKPAIPISTAVR